MGKGGGGTICQMPLGAKATPNSIIMAQQYMAWPLAMNGFFNAQYTFLFSWFTYFFCWKMSKIMKKSGNDLLKLHFASNAE